ncbi:hypothetical protein [Mycolicibacterium sp. BK556]|uniref:hypothetical protein n=1 Tax=Mycolicibacterium sp. BK556 TaxID=2587125 RepID=UPI0010F316B4|nr:hypothetical protein EV580_6067 [Mycobacterium sp. BK086]
MPVIAAILTSLVLPASASADPAPPPINANECNDAFCTPGITPGVELGAPCDNTTYYVFGVDTRNNWGRLIFCGSPRRYAPRYFRSPPMVGVKNFNDDCTGYENSVAQAPDGMFLTCIATGGATRWVQGDA